jgi:hypothetical protein
VLQTDQGTIESDNKCTKQVTWPASFWPDLKGGTPTGSDQCNLPDDYFFGMEPLDTPLIKSEHCDVTDHGVYNWPNDVGSDDYSRKAQTKWKLYTGGKATPKAQSVWMLSATAGRVLYKRADPASPNQWATTNIDFSKITLMGKTLDPQGNVYVVLDDDSTQDVTPDVEGVDFYTFTIAAHKVHLGLRSVTFNGTGYHDVVRETADPPEPGGIWGLPYPTPHWTNDLSGPVQSSPALYSAGHKVQTSTGFKLAGDGGFPIIVKGEVSGGLTSFSLWGTNSPSGTTWSIGTIADTNLVAKVDFYKPMTIKWKYAAAAANPPEFIDADNGTSTNRIYVSLREPDPEVILIHTLVQLACDKPTGMSVDSNVVAAIWDNFPPLQVKRLIDGAVMTYWDNVEDAGDNSDSFSLIIHADGSCGGWARLFWDAQKIHGITASTLMRIDPKPGYAEIGIYPSLPAQGNPHPRYNFSDHGVIERSGVVYDPSYGKIYNTTDSHLAWEDTAVNVYYAAPNMQNPTNDVKGVLETQWSIEEQ